MSARNLDAVILAAGRGERMRPLTDHTPKPLLEVRGKRLIEWHLEALARAGVKRVVINTAWLEDQFPAVLGDGFRWGLAIRYSTEGRDHGGALETAGGIAKVLPWLGDCFWVVSGDVFVPNFRFDPDAADRFAAGNRLGQLWLAPNAAHHPQGDFGIDDQGLAVMDERPRRTWASVGLFHAEMFAGIPPGTRLKLTPLLHQAIAQRRLGAQPWDGGWTDVGTPERLEELNLRSAP
jgi:MurNAc alpha-1-phosphate uridylyltransferase